MASFIVSNGQSSNRRVIQSITFTQDDALVARIVVAKNGLKRMLVNHGILVNKIYGSTFDKLEVDHELTLVTFPLHGFTGDSIIPRGKFTLSTKIGIAPLTAPSFIEFLLVDHHSAYLGYWENQV